MSADRHDDDAPYRGLRRWENLAEQRIRAAQEEGLFDDLPGSGQPLTLDDNPLAGEMQVGFRLLKNAGFAPEWIELDKEIRAELDALRDLREHAARRVAESGAAGDVKPPRAGKRLGSFRRTRAWVGLLPPPPKELPPHRRMQNAVAERERARAAYLDRAARLTERVIRFNTLRPRDLWELERTVPTAERHAADFDAVCPPVVVEADQDTGRGSG